MPCGLTYHALPLLFCDVSLATVKDVCDLHALESDMIEAVSVPLKVGLMRKFPFGDQLQIIGRGSTALRKVFELTGVRGAERCDP